MNFLGKNKLIMNDQVKEFFNKPLPKGAKDHIAIWFNILDIGDELIRELEECRLIDPEFKISGADLSINNVDIY